MGYNLLQNSTGRPFYQVKFIKYLTTRKHVTCFYQVIETQVEVWENKKSCGNMSALLSVFTAFF